MSQRSCQHSFGTRRKCRIHRSISKALSLLISVSLVFWGRGGRHWTRKIFKLVITEWLEGEERKVLHINYSKIRKDVWWDLKMKSGEDNHLLATTLLCIRLCIKYFHSDFLTSFLTALWGECWYPIYGWENRGFLFPRKVVKWEIEFKFVSVEMCLNSSVDRPAFLNFWSQGFMSWCQSVPMADRPCALWIVN